MKFLPSVRNRKGSAARRSSSCRRLVAEPLEARLALDAHSLDFGGQSTGDQLPAGAIRFFLSERGVGESPTVANPTIHMELGETATLYLWMQLPSGTGLYGAGVTVVSATSGVLQSLGTSVYEPTPGSRWLSRPNSWGTLESYTAGDILGQPAAYTFSPRDMSMPSEQLLDPSYDPETGSYLFGTIDILAANVGETDLVMEVGTFAVAPWQPGDYMSPDLPIYFGVGDEAVHGFDTLTTGSLADARVVVTGETAAARVVADYYEANVVWTSVVEIPASAGVLANDQLPPAAAVELVAPPRMGTLQLNADGSFQYTVPKRSDWPTHLYGKSHVNESFAYRVNAPDGTSGLARVTLRLNAGLVAVDDNLAMDVRVEPFKRLDREIIWNDLWFTQAFWATRLEIVSPPENGQITYHYGEFGEYTPNLGFRGRDRFTYGLTDGVNATTATVFIDVTYENRAPVAAADEIEVRYDEFIEPELLLANDSDPDGDVLSWDSVRIVDGPQHGTLTKFPGSLLYQAASTFTGVDSFSYVVDDGMEESNVVTVTLRVSPPPAQEDDMEETPNEAVGCPNDNFAPGGLGARLQAALCGIQAGGFEPGLVDQVVVGDLVIGGDVDQGWAGNIIGVDVHLQLNGNAAEAITPRVANRVQARRRVAVDVIAADEHFGRSPLAVETRTERRGARRIGRR